MRRVPEEMELRRFDSIVHSLFEAVLVTEDQILPSEADPMGRPNRIFVQVARFAMAAWLGAAALFVAVGIREVTHSGFDSTVRDQLVVVRFPLYYGFGFTGLTVAVLCLASFRQPRGYTWLPFILLCGCLIGMIFEYNLVYRPLVEAITPPGKPRTPEFISLHEWSKWGNLLEWIVCACAYGLLDREGFDSRG